MDNYNSKITIIVCLYVYICVWFYNYIYTVYVYVYVCKVCGVRCADHFSVTQIIASNIPTSTLYCTAAQCCVHTTSLCPYITGLPDCIVCYGAVLDS